jgi:hypothetical protein
VQNAIATTKSYETLTVTTDGDTKLTTITLNGGKGASLDSLTKLVAKAGFTVTDVTWTARPVVVTMVMPVTIPLKGLTAENGPRVQAALSKLTRTTYQCAECGWEADAKGDCPDCEKALTPESGADALLRGVSVDAGKGLATLTVSAPDGVRLTEFEGALAGTGVSVNRASMAVLPYCRIMVSGVDEAHPASLVQKAIAATKSYETLSVATDEETKLTTITLMGGKGMSLASLSDVVAKTGLKLTDVTWTAPCTACAKQGMTRGNCPNCMGDGS